MTARILIVDDELGALALIAIILERAGFLTSKAANRKQALHLLNTVFATTPPDLIVLDMIMPGLDSLDFIHQLRQHPDTCNTPILMLFHHLPDPSAIQAGFDAGANKYVTKPILYHELVDAVRTCLNISSSNQTTS